MQRIVVWIGVVAVNLPIGLKAFRWFLDLIGWSTVLEDAKGLFERLDQMPWWVAFFLAFAAWATYFLSIPLWERRSRQIAEMGKFTRNTWLQHTVFYLLCGKWPNLEKAAFDLEENGFPTERFAHVNHALKEIRQKAFDGTLQVWGKPMRSSMSIDGTIRSGLFEEIPKSHWRTHQVRALELILDPEQVYTSFGQHFDENSYCSLMVDIRQVETLWPDPRQLEISQ
jgi:hypothetical protein